MASNPSDLDYSAVLKAVSSWPPKDRIALARDVLGTLEADVSEPRPRKRTLERALGLACGEGPPPTDEDVRRWVDEYRTRKCGA